MRNKIVGIFAGFAAIFCICSCTQSLDPNIPADKPSSSDSGEEFGLFAEVTEGFSADVVQSGATTKTILNDDWTVSWSESDLMSVFNRGAGENTWSDNCRFVVSDPARGGFVKDASESTKKLISGKDSYDWYACSPWNMAPIPPGQKDILSTVHRDRWDTAQLRIFPSPTLWPARHWLSRRELHRS